MRPTDRRFKSRQGFSRFMGLGSWGRGKLCSLPPFARVQNLRKAKASEEHTPHAQSRELRRLEFSTAS